MTKPEVRGSPALVKTPDSFEEFYRKEYRRLVGLAFTLTGSRTAAEELCQDALIAAYRHWENIDNPEAWVRRVLVNRSRSWVRRKVAELRAVTRIRNRRQPLAKIPDSAHEFWVAVRALPQRQSQVMVLHYLEDRSVSEIAELLACSPGAVKTHLYRGRKTLAGTLDSQREV